MDYKLEVVLIPVTDVDQAGLYDDGRFNVDVDHGAGDDFRVVQLTPTWLRMLGNSSASDHRCTPGIRNGHSSRGERHRGGSGKELIGRGIDVSEVRHMTPDGWQPGPDPEHAD